MRRWGLSSSILEAVLGRSALAIWLCNLDLCSWVVDFPGVLNADDGMLDWIVSSKGGPGVDFPSFRGHLFDLIKEGGFNVDPMLRCL